VATPRESAELARQLRAAIRDVPDFPTAGILFRDITPMLAQPGLFRRVVAGLAAPFEGAGVTHVVGIESRGFILGAPVALHLEAAFTPIRKPGKLPFRTRREGYALEYGTDALEIHEDAVGPMHRVLVVDDVLATGGTAAAACALVQALGATTVSCAFLIEIEALHGRERLGAHPVHTLVSY